MFKSLLTIFSLLILFNSSYSQSKGKKVFYDDWPTTRSSNVRLDKESGAITVNFVPIGTIWDHNIITYFFQNGTDDINADNERQAVRDGFSLWSNVTNLVFLEVCNAADADIVILWGIFNHGDAGPFDGPNGILAHTLGGPPPNAFGAQAGDIHFDDSETWSLNVRNNREQPIDLITVAAHEIGHSLGLDHTQVAGSIMLANYTGSHRFLGSDDVAGIQSLYGNPDANFFINGSIQLCLQENYTIPNLPAGATVTWSILPTTGRATLTTFGNTATLTKTGDGNVQLLATVNSAACGNVNLTPLNVYVGVPIISDVLYSSYQVQVNSIIPLSVLLSNGYFSTRNKFVISKPGYNKTIYSNSPNPYISFSEEGLYDVAVYAINDCGISDPYYLFFVCGDEQYLNIYPNPASSDLTIEYAPIENTSTKKTSISSKQKDIKLLNNKGEIMLFSMMKENELKLTLDTKNIPAGTYFLHITEGKKIIKKQIIIKH